MTEVDIMAIDSGWNTRNTEIPSPGEAALASIRLERVEWKGTGQKLALEKGKVIISSISSSSSKQGWFSINLWWPRKSIHNLYMSWSFLFFYISWSFLISPFIWSRCLRPITSDWVLPPNWPVRRWGRWITNCNHLPFSTSSTSVHNHLQHVIQPNSHKVFNQSLNIPQSAMK